MLKSLFKAARPFMVMVVIIAIFLVAFLLVDGITRNKEPQPAPDATGVLYSDQSLFALSDNFGKTPTVLVFFDPQEQKTLTHLMQVYEAGNTRADIIGVSISQLPIDQQKPLIEAAGAQQARILLDPEGAIAQTYRITGVPVTYFIDKNGLIHEAHLSGITAKTLEKAIAKIA